MPEEKKKIKLSNTAVYSLCAVSVMVLIVVGAYLLWEKPPETSDVAAPLTEAEESPAPTEEPIPESAPVTERQDGVYTILVVGIDVQGGNTDTIMVGKLDSVKHTLDVASIPRDTLVNEYWWLRKINAAYANEGAGDAGIEALKNQVQRLMGFRVDCYAMVDLMLFQQVIDAIGGVDYDVPIAMDYDLGPVIHLQPGYQHLNGEQALGVMRFRSGYAMGDLDRLEAQHDFLKAVAKQFLELGNVPNLRKVLKLFETGLVTDLENANIAYFVRQALMCRSEDITFYTMPNRPVDLNGFSYVTVEVSDWLDMINEHLNPYSEPIGYGNVDIIFREWNGYYRSTAGIRESSYFPTDEEIDAAREEKRRAEEEALNPTPEPSPTPEPVPEETPVPAESPATPEPVPEPTPVPEPPAEAEPAPESEPPDEPAESSSDVSEENLNE